MSFLFDKEKLFTYGKIAREISKFFGYIICFNYGKNAIKHTEKAWKLDFRFICSALLFLVIEAVSIAAGVSSNTALLRIICGLLGSKVIISLFFHYKQHSSRLSSMIAKYSVEIYLIDVNIFCKFILPLILASINLTGVFSHIILVIVLFVIDIALSLGIAFLERYIMPIDFIFHPAKYLKILS